MPPCAANMPVSTNVEIDLTSERSHDMHPSADRVRENLDRETPAARKARQEATARAIGAEIAARHVLLTELLDIANGHCPDLEGGLAFVAKVLHEHLSSHP